MRISRAVPLLAMLFAVVAWAGGAARATPTVIASHSRASLLAESAGYTPGQPLRLGLRIALAPGWHTYWSNPGDAGLPPDVTVALDGAKPFAPRLLFPTPRRLPTGPLMGYGYEGDVLLPFDVTPSAGTADPLHLAMHADWLVCATVCVPQSADLSLDLPRVGSAAASADAGLFTQASLAMPRPAPFAVSLSDAGALHVAGAGLERSVRTAWFMPDTPGLINQAAPQRLALQPGALTLALDPLPALAVGGTVSGVLVLEDASGQQTALLVKARRGSAPPSASAPGLPRLLILALLGGLILNLMPCVFPVIAMKAIAFGRHGPESRGAIRRSAALYTAGILASFVLAGAVLLAVRAAGGDAGWGSQFQSPPFVAGVAWLLFAVGLNLAGLFEVGSSWSGTGQTLAARGGAIGDLMTGVLAVVVATPCTAPFMGAAVAASLSASPAIGLLIFLALGLGLALPSLVLGFVPGVGRLLPRPGPWMVVTRQLLALPMFAAAIWLLWVLSVEAGPGGVLAGLIGVLLIGFGGWLHGLVQRGSLRHRTRRVMSIAAFAAVLASIAMLPGIKSAEAPQTASNGTEPFSPARLAALRAAGRPVFVDMSAAWCVTCLVNERLALAPPSVRAAFASGGVTLLRGDWTRRDAGITDFLHRFGRDGVPLYVFFPSAAAEPRVLPQILTPGVVRAAIAEHA